MQVWKWYTHIFYFVFVVERKLEMLPTKALSDKKHFNCILQDFYFYFCFLFLFFWGKKALIGNFVSEKYFQIQNKMLIN